MDIISLFSWSDLETLLLVYRRELANVVFTLRDDTHMTSMKVVQFLRFPTLLVDLRPKFFHPLDLGHLISSKPPPFPLQMKTSQLKENIMQGWILYAIRSFLQFGFRFQYQLINFVWFSFDFMSFSWTLTICFFVALYACICSYQLCAIIHIFLLFHA